MQARHESKHMLNYGDAAILRSRLRAALPHDVNAGANGEYVVRSLYFDTPRDRALREKIDGVNHREKYRIRLYNGNTDVIHLERKSKHNGLGYKESANLTAAQAQAIIDGDIAWMMGSGEPLLMNLYSRMRGELLRPRTIVEYTREPFTYGPGNVRITLDSKLHTGLSSTGFLGDVPLVPAGDLQTLLEVKYDAFLPQHIRDLLQLNGRGVTAFSKYAACRTYG